MFYYCLSIIYIYLHSIKTREIMKNNNKLVTLLYILSQLSYRFIQLLILYLIFFEFFTPNGKIGNWSSSNHHSIGYTIPMNFSLQQSNEFQYSETSKIQKDSIKFSLLDKIYHSSSGEETSRVYKIVDYIPSGEIKLENIEHHYRGAEITNVTVKTSNTFINIALGFRRYLYLLCDLIIFYFCIKIFKTLRKNSTFPEAIAPYLNKIGLLLLGQGAIKMSYYFIDSYIIDLLRLRSDLFSDFQYYALFDVNMYILVLGLTLLFLSSIFKRGNEIESENELTI